MAVRLRPKGVVAPPREWFISFYRGKRSARPDSWGASHPLEATPLRLGHQSLAPGPRWLPALSARADFQKRYKPGTSPTTLKGCLTYGLSYLRMAAPAKETSLLLSFSYLRGKWGRLHSWRQHRSQGVFSSEEEALDAAWQDAATQVKSIQQLSDEAWAPLSLEEQCRLVRLLGHEDLGLLCVRSNAALNAACLLQSMMMAFVTHARQSSARI